MPDRIARIRRSMNELRLDAFLISTPSHLRYVFGFTGSNGMGLLTPGRAFFVTDWRYRDQAQEEVREAEVLVVYRDLLAILKERQLIKIGDRIGFEEHHLSYAQVVYFKKTFPHVQLVPTQQLIAKVAMQKSPAETDLIKKAVEVTCQTWEQVLPWIKPGVTEADLTAEIIYRSRKLGSQLEAFEPIVASGPRSALPHGRSSNRALAAGDMVVVDFGCVVEGYASDFTRTIAIGEPEPKLRAAYRAVQQACELVYAAVRPGMEAKELDAVARKHLEAQGLAQHFNHSLGHGIGLEVHSLPRIGPESKDVIPLGAVLAIEPGVYFPGVGGVRIEDDVRVTETGGEVLTTASRELICVE